MPEFAAEAQLLIKIMHVDYDLPLNTGSELLGRSSSEYFNRKTLAAPDQVKRMEQRYKILDPESITLDTQYSKLGPIGLIGTRYGMTCTY